MKRVFNGFMEMQNIQYDCGTLMFQQLHPIFFLTADNWIMITGPITNPREIKMWHYYCKEKKWALRWGGNFK